MLPNPISFIQGTLHSRLLSCVLAGLGDPTVNLKTTFSMLTPNIEHKVAEIIVSFCNIN